MWRLCLSTLEWTHIEVPSGDARPSARGGHVMTSVGLDLWVHGGKTDSLTGEGDTSATRALLLLLNTCAAAELMQRVCLFTPSVTSALWCVYGS
jgi:hypothetical protein